MGFKISWIAVEGMTKPQLLAALGFSDTDIEDATNETPLSAAELGNGWSMIWSNNVDWVNDKLFKHLPPDAHVVAVRLHEGLMYAEAFGTNGADGRWRVAHDAERSLTHLVVDGTPPKLKDVRDRLLEQQAADAGGEVDYVFDVPIEIAARLTSFRHDGFDTPLGPSPRFTAVTSARSTTSPLARWWAGRTRFWRR